MILNKSGNTSSMAGAFTPLWSAVGGLLGPAFMPGFRRDRKPKRARPRATIPAASCRAQDDPRIDSASSTGRLGGHAVPRPLSNGAWSSTRAQEVVLLLARYSAGVFSSLPGVFAVSEHSLDDHEVVDQFGQSHFNSCPRQTAST
jgi:hypothetical protein